jgi:hypothetical protein
MNIFQRRWLWHIKRYHGDTRQETMRKSMKTTIWIAGITAEIRSGHLENAREAEFQSREAVKYGHESRGTRNQE